MYGQTKTAEDGKRVNETPKRGPHPVLVEKWKQILYAYSLDDEYYGRYSIKGVQIIQGMMLADAKHLNEEKRKDVSRLAEGIIYYMGNKDVLTEEEFLTALQKNVDNNTIEELITSSRRRFFYCMDLNNDGEISLEEFKMFYKAIRKEGTSDAEKAFKYIDANGDGAITMDEYIHAFLKYMCDESVSVYDLPLFGVPSVK